ncbi:MAG: class I SAM-dependent methyltransferase [Promethearchaeota archaeon]
MTDFLKLIKSYNYYIFRESFYNINLMLLQSEYELSEFIKIIAKIRPKTVIEIGTFEGGTTFVFSRFSKNNAHIITIDLPTGGGGIMRGGYSRLKIPFFKLFASKNQKITLIRKDSHQYSTYAKVKKKLKNEKADILFIDGDHSYEGVKKDFEMYSPLVKKNGIIAFHDIVKTNPKLFPLVKLGFLNVNKFWNEIKENYEYFEIVEDWNDGLYGIGIIKI